MPAAAVIPAPIAYIKVVAVKKLVVGFLTWRARSSRLDLVLERTGHPSRERLCHWFGGRHDLDLLL